MHCIQEEFIKNLETLRNSKVIVYVTGDRPNLETQIHSEVLDFFADHLDTFSLPSKITLVLYSPGGDTLAAWTIANLIRQFCNEFEVIVPSKARSAATLISLGADRIVMTKQATLGPIDPSVTTPLNPHVPGAPERARLPLSVEAVAGYFDLARNQISVQDPNQLCQIFLKLTDHVHPVALGAVSRARTQIQRLAVRLLRYHMRDEARISKIISALCSESGSHDYTINRREARDDLGLNIETPDQDLYFLIKSIHENIRNALRLNEPYFPDIFLGEEEEKGYHFIRSFIQSLSGGTHLYVSEGILTRIRITNQIGIEEEHLKDKRLFEGWRHENS